MSFQLWLSFGVILVGTASHWALAALFSRIASFESYFRQQRQDLEPTFAASGMSDRHGMRRYNHTTQHRLASANASFFWLACRNLPTQRVSLPQSRPHAHPVASGTQCNPWLMPHQLVVKQERISSPAEFHAAVWDIGLQDDGPG